MIHVLMYKSLNHVKMHTVNITKDLVYSFPLDVNTHDPVRYFNKFFPLKNTNILDFILHEQLLFHAVLKDHENYHLMQPAILTTAIIMSKKQKKNITSFQNDYLTVLSSTK